MAVVSRLLTARALERPAAAAFTAGADGRSMTWSELASHAEIWRAASRATALPERARIGLVATDPLAFPAAYLGVLAAGLTAVPLDPRLTASELSNSIARLRVDVVATDAPDAFATEAELWSL